MNKVFKTVWNASLGVWVAVSETASSQKKGSNKLKKAAANAVATVATVAIGAATIGGAHAAGWGNLHGNPGSVGDGSVSIGASADHTSSATSTYSVAVGGNVNLQTSKAVAVGYEAKSGGDEAVSLGYKANAVQAFTTAIGTEASAYTDNSLALGYKASAGKKAILDGNGNPVLDEDGNPTFLGGDTSSGAIAIGNDSISVGKNSIALGTAAKAEYEDSIAIGATATVGAKGAIAIGKGDALGENSLVFGGGKAEGSKAQVFGSGTAKGSSALVFGGGTAQGESAQVFGGGNAQGQSAQVFGGGTAVGKETHVFGSGTATGDNSYVFGGGEAVGKDTHVFGGGKAIGEGSVAVANGIANAKNSFALGGVAGSAAENSMVISTSGSEVTGKDSFAIGNTNRISTANTFALGSSISGRVANSVMLGYKSVLSDVYLEAAVMNPEIRVSTFIEDENGNPVEDIQFQRKYDMQFAGMAKTAANGAVSVGAEGLERQIQHVGAGRITEKSTDAINGSQLYDVLHEVAKLEKTPITFLDADGGQATVKLGDTFNIEGATVSMVGDKPVLTVNAASAAWKLATGGDVTNASTIGGDTNVVDFVGSKNAKVSQTVLTDATGKPIGTQVNVEVADQIQLTENGGLTIAGGDVFVLDADGNKIPETDADGNPVVDAQGNPVYLTQNYNPITINQGNVNFGGNVISGVAPGVAGTDAVNVDQLKGSGWGLGNATVLDVDGNVVTDANNQPVTTAKINPDDQVEHKAGPSNNVTVNTKVQKVAMTDENGDVVVDANGQPVLIDKATVTVDLADQINLSKDGGLTIAGVPKLDVNGDPELDQAGNPVYEAGKAPITINQGNVSFGGNQLNDVAAGQDDTDAVNVSQLKDALDTLGGGATVNPDGSINAPSYTVGAGNTTVNTVGDAIDVLNQGFTLTSSNASGAADETIQAGDKIDITVTKENNNLVAKQDGSTIEFALANQIALTGDTAGLTIGAGSNGNQPIVIQQGNVSFGGNVLQNVGAGVNPTDAVNVSQLQSAGWNIITQNKDAAGNVTGTTENAVNGDKAENTSAVQFNGDNNISVSQNSVTSADGKTTTTIEVELEKDIDLSEEGSLTIGNTLLNDAGLTLAGATVGSNVYGPIVINQGNVSFGGNRLQNVATGVDGTDAVNVDQLKDEIGKAVSDSGWTLTTAGDSTSAEKIKPNDTVDFSGDALGNIQVSNTGGNVTIALDPTVDLTAAGSLTIGDTLVNNDGLSVGDTSVNKDGLTVAGNGVAQLDAAGNVVRDQDGNVVYTTGKGDITVEQDNVSLGGNQINDVARADQDHQAVNLGQLKDELGGLEETINNNIANSGWNLTGQDADGNAVTEKVNPDETVEFVAGPSGNTTVTTESTPNGAKVTVDINDQLNLTGDAGSLTIGAGKGNNAITIEQGNVSVGGNQIHNLAAGTDGKDAVNVDQLKGTVNIFGGGAAVNPDGSIKAPTYNVNGGSYDNVGDALGALNQADIDLGDRVTNLQQSFNNRIDDVEDRMSAGIASAMALETAPYVPGKYTYAAATAYHNGQAALGITLRKTADNGRWSLTGGVATGTEGDPSVRLGVSGIID